ncbi:MAG: 7-carboxy-7-deazaguanine synthase QueE [Planctomycetota bacterium]
MAESPIVSVFSSIQGEGLHLGRPHLFIRLAGCNIRCSYCDTPEGLTIPKYGRIETRPFGNTFRKCPNPVDGDYLLNAIKRLAARFSHYHAIVLTGGEPLVHSAFLKSFLRPLRRLRIPVMLETNGTLPEQLNKVINLVDIISMDIKTPSDINGYGKIWAKTRRFLNLANRRNTYIKVVVTDNTNISDCRKAAGIIARVNRNIPLILQPVSAVRKSIRTPLLTQIIRIHNIFTKELADVKIIPQMHKIAGWR